MWTKLLNQFNRPYSSLSRRKHPSSFKKTNQSGFTLIELMITIAIVSILAGVAIPSYISFTKNRDVSSALTTLINLSTQMQKTYVDSASRSYRKNGTCGVSDTTSNNYGFVCTSSDNAHYQWTATSTDTKYQYTIDQDGNKKTKTFNGSTPSDGSDCWKINDHGGCF